MRNVFTRRRVHLTLFVVAALVIAMAAPAVAARGGNKAKAQPTLSVAPMEQTSSFARNGAMPYGEMSVSGDGYVKETAILVKFYPMDTGYLTDADGTSFDFEWMPPGPGEYKLVSWQVTKRGKWEKATEVTFTVGG